jgi:citrate synthase
MEAIADTTARESSRRLPINAAGAVGAICCEIMIPWQAVRGVGVAARAVGLVGHILEETEYPIAREIWLRSEEEASMHSRGK